MEPIQWELLDLGEAINKIWVDKTKVAAIGVVTFDE